MRVALATFYQAVNAGAYLQQFALRRVLEQCGIEVEILRYHSSFGRNEYRSRFHRHSGLARISSLGQVARFRKLTQKDFTYTRRLVSGEKFDWSPYAAVICGSDEIWNITNWYSGYCPILFGKGIEGPRKITYAASFGEVSGPEDLPEEVAGLLADFHSLSVRDDNSVRLVHAMTGRQPHLSLDPTLLYDFEEEIAARPATRPGSLIVYATHVEPAYRDAVLDYARRAGVPIFALGFPHDWADSTLAEVHPLKVLSEFLSAHAVLTNTFHGVALAAKFGLPFVLGDLSGKHNKVSSLLELLELAPPEPLSPADWDAAFTGRAPAMVATRIAEERERSLTYLAQALDGLA